MRKRNRLVISNDGRWPAERREDEAIRNPLSHRWGSASTKTGEKKRKESGGARPARANHEAPGRPSQPPRRDDESIRDNQSINQSGHFRQSGGVLSQKPKFYSLGAVRAEASWECPAPPCRERSSVSDFITNRNSEYLVALT